jgi:hypothetical protein
MAMHNLIDIAAGGLLAASPWIFGFADETASILRARGGLSSAACSLPRSG